MKFTPVRTAIIAIVALFGVLLALPNFFSKETLATWPDGSVKWSGFAVAGGPDLEAPLSLSLGTPAASASSLQVRSERRMRKAAPMRQPVGRRKGSNPESRWAPSYRRRVPH